MGSKVRFTCASCGEEKKTHTPHSTAAKKLKHRRWLEENEVECSDCMPDRGPRRLEERFRL